MGALDRIFRRRPDQQRPLESYVRGLFGAGEQGVWYDPSDLSSMYQDPAGTTPVYLPGQGQVDPPVGLLLDKRLGLELGTALALPDFSTSAWLKSAAATATGPLAFSVTGAGGVFKAANNYFAIGRYYDVSISFTKSDSTTPFSLVNADSGAASTPAIASSTAASGTLRTRWLATSGGIYFRLGAAASISIVAISVREIPGNHAYQATATSRPTLSARHNLVLASEKFDDAYWAITANFDVATTAEIIDPDGGNAAWKITSTTGAASLSKVVGAGFKNPVFTIWVKAGTHTPVFLLRNQTTATNLISRTVSQTADFSNGYGTCKNFDIGDGWRKIRIEITSGISQTDQVAIYFGATQSVPVGQYFYLRRIDLREANDGVGLPEYQRVVDASTYDTAGFPLYLRFDGVDDWLQTAAIDFSATGKATILPAFRKLSDAARGMLCEFSADINVNAGAFALEAPDAAAAKSLRIRSSGSTQATAGSVIHPAPGSYVAVHTLDIGAPKTALRVNGALVTVSSASQGSGNLGNYPLFIGRRGGTSLPFNGRIYGLIIRGAATPNATIARVERYLNAKSRAY